MTVELSEDFGDLGAGKVEVYQLGPSGASRVDEFGQPYSPSTSAIAPPRTIEFAPGFMAQKPTATPWAYRPPTARSFDPSYDTLDPSFFERHQTLLIGAGVLLVGGAVAYMLFKPARGFRRTAMAGLGDQQRSAAAHRVAVRAARQRWRNAKTKAGADAAWRTLKREEAQVQWHSRHDR